MNAELFIAVLKLVAVVAGVTLFASIWWRSRKQPDLRLNELKPSKPQPFRGWEPINRGEAGLGQIGPALRDLNARLRDIEEYLSELRKGPAE